VDEHEAGEADEHEELGGAGGSVEKTGSQSAKPATISFVTLAANGRPGLAKTRGLPLVIERSASLLRAPDPRWRELFASADAVSEGGARQEDSGRVWYGSTSLILLAPGADAARLTALAAQDVHVRMRAIRAARREACLRAPSPLGRVTCEIRFQPDARGVRIDVDVQAPLIESRASNRSAR
jgi:hypothetical protein